MGWGGGWPKRGNQRGGTEPELCLSWTNVALPSAEYLLISSACFALFRLSGTWKRGSTASSHRSRDLKSSDKINAQEATPWESAHTLPHTSNREYLVSTMSQNFRNIFSMSHNHSSELGQTLLTHGESEAQEG